jgi:hypothetical protein
MPAVPDEPTDELIKKLDAEFGPPAPVPIIPPEPAQPVVVHHASMPAPAPSRPRHKARWPLIALILILLGGGIGYGLLTPNGSIRQTIERKNALRSYDSPIGLLAPMQEQAIRSGKFKVSTEYANGEKSDRQGSFHVDETGRVSYEVLPDIATVNELITFLYQKEGVAKPALADRNFRYDFQSILGYSYLYGADSLIFQGFIAKVEGSSEVQKQYSVTKTPTCDQALSTVKELTGANYLNTAKLGQDVSKDLSAENRISITAQSLTKTDQAVQRFFDDCFDFPEHGLVEYADFVKQVKERTAKSPSFTILGKDKNGRTTLKIKGASPAQNLNIQIWDLNTKPTQLSGSTGSYLTSENIFGLAYSSCRVVPVAYSDFAASYSYEFAAEDTMYPVPSELTSGYSCATSQVPTGYSQSSYLTLNFKQTGDITFDTASSISLLAAKHDFTYQLEQHWQKTGNYPATLKRDDILQLLTQEQTNLLRTAFEQGTYTYQGLPSGCTTKCDDYALTMILKDTQRNVTVELNKSAYGKLKNQ